MITLNDIRMGPKLTGLFLMVGLMPLALVGWFAIHEADKALLHKAMDQLESVREIQGQAVEAYFEGKWDDLRGLVSTVTLLHDEGFRRLEVAVSAQKHRVEDYFDRMQGDFKRLREDPFLLKTLQAFLRDFAIEHKTRVETQGWQSLAKQFRPHLQKILQIHAWADVMLMDTDGTVLFTVANGMEQGRSLQENPLRRTGLGVAFAKTQRGEGALDGTVLVDFAPYEPASGKPSFFMMAPVLEDSGKHVGYVAVRVLQDDLNHIMSARAGLGETGEVYLVGRSGDETTYRHDRHVKRGQFGERRSDVFIDRALAGHTDSALKRGSTGRVELIHHAPLDMPGLQWAALGTIRATEAFVTQRSAGDASFFDHYLLQHGLRDLFLINAEGAIFYTQAGETDAMGNLLRGALADTHFGRMVQRVIQSGKPALTDFEAYAPSHHAQAAFLAMPVFGRDTDDRSVEMVVALQISLDALNALVHENKGMGKTGETFLLGKTAHGTFYRTDRIVGVGKAGQEVIDPVAWDPSIHEHIYGETHRLSSSDSETALVSHKALKIPGLDWSIITTMHAHEVEAPIDALVRTIYWFALGLALLVMMTGLLTTRGFLTRLSALMKATTLMASGDWSARVTAKGRDEIGWLGETFNIMASTAQDQFWLQSNLAQLGDAVQQTGSPQELAQDLIAKLANLVGGGHGVIYLRHRENHHYERMGSYGYKARKHLSSAFVEGEGLVGQCVREKQSILLTEIPEDYVKITSGLGESTPREILVIPVVFQGAVLAVVELSSFSRFTPIQRTFLEDACVSIGLGLENQTRRIWTESLLKESQLLTEELAAQQEELKMSNEALQEQTQALQQSEAHLQEKSRHLESHQKDLEAARVELEKKAEDLGRTSRYKTDFLANMSHELRSPLNSLIILAKIFAENQEHNLTPEQIESARIILESGQDLLELINDVLDLSKIEAGKMDLHLAPLVVVNMATEIKDKFGPLARAKNLELTVTIEPGTPEAVQTDIGKALRILRNFLSNAIKFTEKGRVEVHFEAAPKERRIVEGAFRLEAPGDLSRPKTLAIRVLDTGIGIPEADQSQIFEAFQQLDAGANRRFSGTGLGLSIAREMARLLSAEIRLKSRAGEGSVFTLLLPEHGGGMPGEGTPGEGAPARGAPDVPPSAEPPLPIASVSSTVASVPPLADDWDTMLPGDQAILVIEDDPLFSTTVGALIRQKGLKWLAALEGESGLRLAESHRPMGILLDLGLPGMDGWKILDHLKANPATRTIPVHIVSAMDRAAMTKDARTIGPLTKPLTGEQIETLCNQFKNREATATTTRDVLLVEDDPKAREAITTALQSKKHQITVAASAEEAWNHLKKRSFACMILDINLLGTSGFELLDQIAADDTLSMPPVIVHTGRELSKEECQWLQKYTDTIVVKGGEGGSRLLEEVARFLDGVVTGQEEPETMALREPLFKDKTALIVDDDMRNAFALSRALKLEGLQSVIASNGVKALEKLAEREGIDIVLMDIMMPEMDGLETMRRIRQQDPFRTLPILVLSAKAMVEDQQACMTAGANDFLPKPVDMTRLLAKLHTWLQHGDKD